ncbi:MAG: class A beta-lactamase-related serine hydrolase [Acholeplasmatales bacterium]|nr:MAG: class A beta-lactamase-related serine hydrolase [Acholeplasmatales bacterium]
MPGARPQMVSVPALVCPNTLSQKRRCPSMVDFKQYVTRLEKKVPTLQVHLESRRHTMLYTHSSTTLNQTFHSASIGKLVCATLMMQAIEAGLVTLDTPVRDVLQAGMLNHLFVYKDTDYQHQVTIEHLLGHTSGTNDYFEGKTHQHPKFIKQVFADKDHHFTPDELLDFTRKHQRAVGRPGERFLYSDTGYVLLGKILEALYQKPYAVLLRENIFDKLDMADTCLCFYDPRFDASKLAPVVYKGIDMRLANSLSCDYAGGGLQTSAADLARFLKGLFTDQLISRASREKMMVPRHRFHGFMRYGLGMIEVKPNRLAPWIRGCPTLYGGLGSLSVHAFYDPVHDDVYVINCGDASKMRLSFMALLYMIKWLNKTH